MQLIGDKELRRKLLSLAENTQRKVTRQAVNKAATPVVRSAKSKVSVQSGLLKKSMGKRVKTYKQTQTVVAVIGAKRSTSGTYRGKLRRPANYSHLAHNGFVTTDGKQVPGNPFLQQAMAEQEGNALSTLKTEMATGIIREASK